MRRNSPPLRMAWTLSFRLGAKATGSTSTKRLAVCSHQFDQQHIVSGPALGYFVDSSSATDEVSPMNWLPGDVNPATGKTSYLISEEENYEFKNML